MAKKNHAKKALISSLLALFICFTMLIGTTFAWFTDSAVSANNVIKSGNLDIAVEYTLDGENWADLDGAEVLFKDVLWEPGHTRVVALKIKNAGNLALKYAANMNIVKETVGKNKEGGDIVLSDILEVSTLVQQTGQIGDIALSLAFSGENSVAYENTADFKDSSVLREDVELAPGVEHYAIIKIDMPETVGNEANHNGTDIPEITFGINVLATQYTSESDSFDNQYDKDAEYATVVSNNEELAKAIEDGKTNLLLKPGEYIVDLYNIDARDSLTINGSGADTTKLSFAKLQVIASKFNKNLTINNCTIERMPDKGWGHLVFSTSATAGVYTISNCVFNGVGSQGIYINQEVPATFNIKNCTFNNDFGIEGAITIQNNDGVNVTVNVTGCKFNNIPKTSHEICVLYEYDGFTLNVQEGVDPYWRKG